MLSEIKTKTDLAMKHALDHFKTEIAHLRSNRASPSMVDYIKFKDAFGGESTIKHAASVSSSEMTIHIQAWDPKNVHGMAKAIIEADIGLTPSSSSTSIMIQVPKLTIDKIKNIIKIARELAEECKISVRSSRQEAMNDIKKLKQAKSISEDEEKRAANEIQKITDDYSKQIEEILARKEQDLKNV